jgi:hypothetical protein
MRHLWPISVGAVGLIVLGVVLGIVLTRGPSPYALKGPVSWKDLPGLQTGKPPWGPNNGIGLSTRLGSLGLDPLSQEALAFHIHQHLDIYVDGKHVTVPANIGIHLDPQNPQTQFITELHTHDLVPNSADHSKGIIHVESASEKRYQLKEFFGEWAVRLTSKCLGSFKGSCDNLHWWVNGKPQVGDPAELVLKSHQEIVISVGTPPKTIPSKYSFPNGY